MDGFGGGLGAAEGSIRLEAGQALAALDQVGASLQKLDRQSATGGGMLSWARQNEQAINTVGLAMTGVGATFLGTFGLGVRAAMGFDQAISILATSTGAAGEDLDNLRELALRLGKDTSFSATEAAAAITELGKSGLSTAQILDGAADAVVNLAVAGEVDLATAATILTGAMNAFGLSASEATMITDTLARGAAVSTADLGDLAQGLTYVGTTANQLGYSIEDTTAALSALNDQNIRGSMAGTALNQMLSSLINPGTKAAGAMEDLGLAAGQTFSVIDEQTGTMKDLGSIIKNVDQATAHLTDVERGRYLNMIFGEQGGRAINALLQTQTEEAKAAGKGWEDYAEGVTSGMTAADVATGKMDNLAGDIEQLKGGLETFGITATTAFLPAIRAVVQGLDRFVGMLTSLPGPVQAAVAGMTGLVGVLGVAGGGFLLLLPRIAATRDAINDLRKSDLAAKAIQRLSTALRGLTLSSPLMWALAAGIAAVVAYKTNFMGFRDAVNGVASAIANLSIVQAVVGWVRDLVGVLGAFSDAFDKIGGTKEIDVTVKGDDKYIEWQEQEDGTVKYAVMSVQDDGSIAQFGEVLESYTDESDPNIAHIKIKGDDGEYWTTVDKTTGEIGEGTIKVEADTKDARSQFDKLRDGLDAIQKAAKKGNMPAIAALAGAAKSAVTGIEKLKQWFDKLNPAVKQVAVSLGIGLLALKPIVAVAGAVASAFGPVLTIIKLVGTALAILTSPIGLIIVGIAALVAGLIYAYTHFEGFRNAVDAVAGALKDFVTGAIEKVIAGWNKLKDAFDADGWSGVWDALLEGAIAAWNGILRFGRDTIRSVVDAIRNVDWGGFLSGAWNAIQTGLQFAWDAITSINWWDFISTLAWDTFVTVLSWADWLSKLNWADYVSKLLWLSWLTTLAWTDFITALDWGTWIDKLVWATYVSPVLWFLWLTRLTWSNFISNLTWRDWVEVLRWAQFINPVHWVAWLTILTWRNFVPKLSWSDWVEVLSWVRFINPFYWLAWVTILSWQNFVPKLSWSEWATVLSWAAFISPFTWITWAVKLAWSEFVPDITWSDFIPSLSWPTKDEILNALTFGLTGGERRDTDQAASDLWVPQSNNGAARYGNLDPTKLGRGDIGPGAAGFDTSWIAGAITQLTNLAGATRTTQAAFSAFTSATSSAVSAWGGTLRSVVTATVSAMQGALTSGTSAGRSVITSFTSSTQAAVSAWGSALRSITSSATSAMQSAISSGMSASTSAVRAGTSQMQSVTQGAMNAMTSSARSGASAMSSALRSGANDAVSGVQSALSRIPGIVASVGSSAASTAYSIGANISSAFASGMYSALGSIQAAAGAMVAAADTALRAKARIQSPSKLFLGLGAFVGEGFERGIRSMIPDVARATSALVTTPGALGPTAYAAQAALYSAPAMGGTTTITYGDNVFNISAHDTEGVKREVLSLLIAGQQAVPAGKV